MRNWLFHPILFYPLAIIIAAVAIIVSLEPQSWPRDPGPVAGVQDGQWLVYEGEAFNSPERGAEEMTVVRDYWGRAQGLRVAQTKAQPPPIPQDNGTLLLLSAQDAAAISGRPLVVEVSYTPSPVNNAQSLALSLRSSDGAASPWQSVDTPPEPSTIRFNLPARNAVNALGIRAISQFEDQAYGLEITRIRIMAGA